MLKFFCATFEFKWSRFFLSSVFFAFGVVSCATPKPIQDFALARQAMQSARKANASKFASDLYHRAEIAYQKAEVAFREGDHSQAKDYFIEAVRFAEESEEEARLKSFKSGEFGP